MLIEITIGNDSDPFHIKQLTDSLCMKVCFWAIKVSLSQGFDTMCGIRPQVFSGDRISHCDRHHLRSAQETFSRSDAADLPQQSRPQTVVFQDVSTDDTNKGKEQTDK